MKASEIRDLIVARRERAHAAGGWSAMATWLKQSHGVELSPSAVEQLYLSHVQSQVRKA